MSDDMSPVFGLEDTPEEPVGSGSELGPDDDLADPMGMAVFDGDFGGGDPEDGSGPDAYPADSDDQMTSAMGSSPEQPADSTASDDSDGASMADVVEPGGSDDGAGPKEDDLPSEDGAPDEGAGETDGENDGEEESFDADEASGGAADDVSGEAGAGGGAAGADGAGDDAAGADGAATQAQTESSSEHDDSSGEAGPDDSQDTAPATDEQTGDLTVSIDGEDVVVGPPTLDITGDGVVDTVVVESDGNVEYYVDTDQDGVADQIIVLDENDGTLVNHEVYDPGTGTWTNVTGESAGTD